METLHLSRRQLLSTIGWGATGGILAETLAANSTAQAATDPPSSNPSMLNVVTPG
jgi:hypothetical protein